MKCPWCPAEFETHSALESHEAGHKVKKVADTPLTYLLVLPDGCTPGRWEAAEAFADAAQELSGVQPNVPFQLVPFSFSQDGGVNALLALESLVVRQCSSCGRKSWGYAGESKRCGMPQPNGTVCEGVLI